MKPFLGTRPSCLPSPGRPFFCTDDRKPNLWLGLPGSPVTIQKFYRRSQYIYTTLLDLAWWYDSNLTVQIQFKSYDMSTFAVYYIIFHYSRYRYTAVSCMERYEKMLKPLFSLFSKYKLFVYGIEMWTKTARLIYFLFDVCGLELPAINDAPVTQCILFRLFRFDGNLFKLILG